MFLQPTLGPIWLWLKCCQVHQSFHRARQFGRGELLLDATSTRTHLTKVETLELCDMRFRTPVQRPSGSDRSHLPAVVTTYKQLDT